MSSKRQKGRAFEFWVRDFLVSLGYSVYVCGRRASMFREKKKDGKPGELKFVTKGDDIFGCDIVAIAPFDKIRFIQATMDKAITKREEEANKYPWNPEHQIVELWQKVKRGQIKVYRLIDHRLEFVQRINTRTGKPI